MRYEIKKSFPQRKLFFVILLFIGGIYGLSIVNSIFVDAMVSDNNEELEKKVNKLKESTEALYQKLDLVISYLEKDKNDNK